MKWNERTKTCCVSYSTIIDLDWLKFKLAIISNCQVIMSGVINQTGHPLSGSSCIYSGTQYGSLGNLHTRTAKCKSESFFAARYRRRAARLHPILEEHVKMCNEPRAATTLQLPWKHGNQSKALAWKSFGGAAAAPAHTRYACWCGNRTAGVHTRARAHTNTTKSDFKKLLDNCDLASNIFLLISPTSRRFH